MTLTEYRRKRDFSLTAEPRGRAAANQKRRIFVVQHHFASQEHYDFRLELDGVLKSWAVPKGPSDDPKVRRLAVQVEDHPLDYADFEGTIPSGQYGAGTVEIWDRGSWTPHEDPHEGLRRGRLSFDLDGEKLTGAWALVRLQPKGKSKPGWLLFRKDLPERRGSARRADPARKGKPRVRTAPRFIEPELATLRPAPPLGDGWTHEAKLDGYRLLGLIQPGRARFLTRNGKDWTRRFAKLTEAAGRLPVESAVLDGEVVAPDHRGIGSFQRLQRAMETPDQPLVYVAFDLLALDGEDLRDRPLGERQEILAKVLKPRKGGSRVIRLVERFDPGEGDPLDQACRRGLEGVVSKRIDAPYVSGRTSSWIKSKCANRQEFVVVGFTEPKGSRTDLGALLVAVNDDDGTLRYAGKVGTGFDRPMLATIRRKLGPLRRSTPPVRLPERGVPRGEITWVRPKLVAEVRFTEWTGDGLLRHPTFEGLRADKKPADVKREGAVAVAGIELTNPDRVLYPELGITKQDLANYYERVASFMMPHVADRPTVLVRCPAGRQKTCFYQKHWTSELPPGLDTVMIEEEAGSTNPYVVIRDAAGLLGLVQHGGLEIHLWGSKADRLEAPDRVVFDLDPGPNVKWAAVRAAALSLRDLLAKLDLASWIKTSGGKGLHIVVPIERRVDWDLTATFARAVAATLERSEPDRYVTVASKKLRDGKIFIDWLRNSRGALSVAPWSTRAREGAPVSVPIRWDSLSRIRSGDHFDFHSVVKLVRPGFQDPWADLLTCRQRITPGMARKLAP